MPYILRFGNIGGLHSHEHSINSHRLATGLAADLVNVYSHELDHIPSQWRVSAEVPRKSWQTALHFVELSYKED